jgi:CTP:molybdopterin cytidylyltransferase MocA
VIATGVLAGERAGPSELSEAEGVPLKVLVDIDGVPMLRRVLDVTGAADPHAPHLVCGPDAAVRDDIDWLRERLDAGSLRWVPTAPSPSASARALVEAAGESGAEAVLLTTGDHPLLSVETLRAFRDAALATGADAVVGLADHGAVKRAFPDSRRTALRFADGPRCGCNLFLFRTGREGAAGATPVLDFWRRVETHRKQPQKILAEFGPGFVVRYLAGRLTLRAAVERLSELTGARVAVVPVADPEAAVDVDNLEDLATVRARFARRAAQAGRGSPKA